MKWGDTKASLYSSRDWSQKFLSKHFILKKENVGQIPWREIGFVSFWVEFQVVFQLSNKIDIYQEPVNVRHHGRQKAE